MKQVLLAAAVVAAAAYVISSGLDPTLQRGTPAHDIYGYFYPNLLYAARRLAVGGKGLLWTPFQNCGQPFFAVISVGLLYPLNLLFLVLPGPLALRGILFVNLLIGGFGTYGLGRALKLSWAGALSAALAFVLGSSTFHLTTWMPTVQGPYVWMPAALWCCERLLQSPRLSDAVLLGVVLALGVFPGHPQFVLFTGEAVALRLVWGLTDRSERRHLARAVGGVGLAVVLMGLLSAVQLLPATEVAAESVRSSSLSAAEIGANKDFDMASIAAGVRTHQAPAAFALVPAFIALVGLTSARHRRMAFFYLAAGALFLALSIGDHTALGRLYAATPLGNLFRMPMRFIFVASFCVAVSTGFAVDALAEGRLASLAAALLGLAGLSFWLRPLRTDDWSLAGSVMLGSVVAALPAARQLGTVLIVAALALAPVLVPHRSSARYLADDRPLHAHAAVLERLRAQLTPQDRIHIAGLLDEPGFEHKTATLFELRDIDDLEPELTRRYAEYLTMLKRGALLHNLNQVYYPGLWNARGVKWPLMDLAAVRFLLVDKTLDVPLAPAVRPALRLVDGDDGIRVYENPAALPRAYYVPQIEVVPQAAVRLWWLAARMGDRRRLALVDAAPASGFLGVSGNQTIADARFVVDEPEHVVLAVDAPQRGFVFLADQYFPGWSATVNGRPVPILAANHAFRLVEVPGGAATVEFRYRPRRVWLGALLSGATTIGLLAWAVRRRRSGAAKSRMRSSMPTA